MKNIFKTVLSGIFVALLTGCGGTMMKEVTLEEKDTSGKYDGLWKVSVHRNPELQYVQNWQMTCQNLEREMALKIVDGKFLNSRNPEINTYIANNGRFKFVQPLQEKAVESKTSDKPMANGSARLIIEGNLTESAGKGFFTIGIAEFGYDGCKAKVSFEKQA